MLYYIEKFQINIYAILILLVILFLIQSRLKVEFYSIKILRIVIIINLLALVMEPITWISDSSKTKLGYYICYISNVLLTMLGPLLAGHAAAYADYKLFKDRKRLQFFSIYMIPVFVSLILLIVNIFTPVIFKIDPLTQVYSAGSLRWVNSFLIGITYLYVISLTITVRNKVNIRILLTVILFFSLPILGMLLQMIYVNLFVSWTTMGLGILIAYILLEITPGDIDYLTNLYSRASYEEFVRHLIEEKKKFMLLMIDLDGFKNINDTYGHYAGDQVLIEFAKILKLSFSSEDMISRLAGDEFIIIIHNENNIKEVIEEIRFRCKENKNSQIRNLQFSFGSHVFTGSQTYDDIYIQVDRKMYHNKNS